MAMPPKILSGTIPYATITRLLVVKKKTVTHILSVVVTKKKMNIPYCMAPKPTKADIRVGDGMKSLALVLQSTQSIGVLAIRLQVL
jgi:hypothetical protein